MCTRIMGKSHILDKQLLVNILWGIGKKVCISLPLESVCGYDRTARFHATLTTVTVMRIYLFFAVLMLNIVRLDIEWKEVQTWQNIKETIFLNRILLMATDYFWIASKPCSIFEYSVQARNTFAPPPPPPGEHCRPN
jgi:hypothetical protein